MLSRQEVQLLQCYIANIWIDTYTYQFVDQCCRYDVTDIKKITHAETLTSLINLLDQVISVWLNVCISIRSSLASYRQGTGEVSPGMPLPALASVPVLLFLAEGWRDGGGGRDKARLGCRMTEVGWR